jgi:quercetin dioxygenase-like cupin family protein
MPDVVRFDEAAADAVDDYESRGTKSVHLGSGAGPSHIYVLHFDPGGFIGTHKTGFGQLFLVVSGDAWVDVEGDRVDVASGQAVAIPRGVQHSKGSETGGTVVMVQMFDLQEI